MTNKEGQYAMLIDYEEIYSFCTFVLLEKQIFICYYV